MANETNQLLPPDRKLLSIESVIAGRRLKTVDLALRFFGFVAGRVARVLENLSASQGQMALGNIGFSRRPARCLNATNAFAARISRATESETNIYRQLRTRHARRQVACQVIFLSSSARYSAQEPGYDRRLI